MSEADDSIERTLDLAESFIAERRYEEAIALSRNALAKRSASAGERSEELIRPLIVLGRCVAERIAELSKESTILAKETVDIASERFGIADIRTARVLCNAALSLRGSGMTGEAVTFLFRALDIAERVRDATQTLWILRVLATSLLQARRYSEALELCARLQGREEERASAPNLQVLANYQLGLCLLRLGHRERARAYLERALEIRAEHRPEGDAGELEELLLEARDAQPDTREERGEPNGGRGT